MSAKTTKGHVMLLIIVQFPILVLGLLTKEVRYDGYELRARHLSSHESLKSSHSSPNQTTFSNSSSHSSLESVMPTKSAMIQPKLAFTEDASNQNSDAVKLDCLVEKKRSNTVHDIFLPIDTTTPAFPVVSKHPRLMKGNLNSKKPTQTSKFYTNMLLATQKVPVYTYPYGIAWSGCEPKAGGDCHNGVGIWHTESGDAVFSGGTPAEYFYSPNHIQHVTLSADELNSPNSPKLSLRDPDAFSVTMVISDSDQPAKEGVPRPTMELPLVQGMAFLTVRYHNCTPVFSTHLSFQDFSHVGRKKDGSNKYIIKLSNGSAWVLFLIPDDSSVKVKLVKRDEFTYAVGALFSGLLQLAKIPTETQLMEIYDRAYGVYPTRASVSGSVSDDHGAYTISWAKEGNKKREPLSFLLPHHVESLSEESKIGLVDGLSLRTPTKGVALGFMGSNARFVENQLPSSIGFLPWSPDWKDFQRPCSSNSSTRMLFRMLAETELDVDVVGQTSHQDSVYDAAKTMASYARIVYAASVADSPSLANKGLGKLKRSLSVWYNNEQKHKLVYDKTWGGVVNSWAFDVKDSNVDFGNAIYNDHHFHYGYLVFAVAVAAELDPSWLLGSEGSQIRHWTNSLVRDYANSVDDASFPFSRSFDWYHGHSWAAGLDPSADGKNEESTSEDVFSLHAIKLWGRVAGDKAMEARANLQLAILKRALKSYFLMESDNKNQPKSFVDNKVSGILYENKIHHTTFFGNRIEYIHGIHMLPISPISAYTRSKNFVTEEWDKFFHGKGAVEAAGGWRSLLIGNQALIDPMASFKFFSSDKFDRNWIGRGESRVYYLFYSSVLAGLW